MWAVKAATPWPDAGLWHPCLWNSQIFLWSRFVGGQQQELLVLNICRAMFLTVSMASESASVIPD